MTTCLISLGGNVGDVPQTIAAALRRLHQPPQVIVQTRSSLYRTTSVGTVAGAEFTNAAAVLDTTLASHELLDRLLAIESEFGRVRTVRWGPRPLDLDLIGFGDAIIDAGPRLLVPHPACWYRRFVLDPLAEIAPDFIHAQKKLPIMELRRRLLIRPLPVLVLEESPALDSLVSLCQADFPEAALRVCHDPSELSSDDSGLWVRLQGTDLPPWIEPLRQRVAWLDATQIPGGREQCLRDILRSAGV